MPLLTAFLTTAIVFLVADAIMLRSVLQPVFSRHLGDALYEGGFRLLPALLFYVSYMGACSTSPPSPRFGRTRRRWRF
jgi:uncharacterized membrane protein